MFYLICNKRYRMKNQDLVFRFVNGLALLDSVSLPCDQDCGRSLIPASAFISSVMFGKCLGLNFFNFK